MIAATFSHVSSCGAVIKNYHSLPSSPTSAASTEESLFNKNAINEAIAATTSPGAINGFAAYCSSDPCFNIELVSNTFQNFGFIKEKSTTPFQVSGDFRYQGLVLNLVNFPGPVLLRGNTIQYDSLFTV